MSILGFDTSTAATSACLLRSDGKAFEHEPPVERLLEPPGHARELMPAIERVMRDAAVGFGDLDGIAVGIGPGGFTGLRIGVATAHGIAQSAGTPLHPVLSLDAVAAGIESDVPFPLIDAKRKEVYGLGPEPFVGSIDYAIEKAPKG